MKYFPLVLLIMLCACTSRTHNIVNCQFLQDSTTNIVEVYCVDKPLDGSAANKDKTFVVYAQDGTVNSISLYDSNDNLLIDEWRDTTYYYDKSGIPLSLKKFSALYPNKRAEFDTLKSKYIHIQYY